MREQPIEHVLLPRHCQKMPSRTSLALGDCWSADSSGALGNGDEQRGVVLQPGLRCFLRGMRTASELLQDVRKLSALVLELALESVTAGRGSLMLVDSDDETYLTIQAAYGLPGDVVRRTRLRFGEGVAGAVAELGLPLLIDEQTRVPHLPLASRRYRSGSFICVPLAGQDEVVGVLNVTEPQRIDRFGQRHLEVLLTLAEHVGPALRRAVRYHEAQQQALRDELTGLYNRRYLWRFLDELLPMAVRDELVVTLLLFDIDHFKQYNDRYGHPAGDEALRMFADIIRRTFRLQDVACRIGGEEFAVVLWDRPEIPGGKRAPGSPMPASPEQAYVFAERLRSATAAHSFPGHLGWGSLTLSGGLAVFPWDAVSRRQLFQRADEALYRAKCEGRNRICVAGPMAADPDTILSTTQSNWCI